MSTCSWATPRVSCPPTPVSGDVDIRLPDGQSYVFDTRTGSGDIDNNLPQTNGADHRIQVETGSGDITIGDG